MDGETKNIIEVWLISIVSICYCYFLARHIPRGIPRLLSLLPSFYLFITLPLKLHSLHAGGATTFFLVWLANFKLLLFSFDKGPLIDSLANHQSKPLLNFIYTALLPIKVKQDPSQKSNGNHKVDTIPPQKSSPKSGSWAIKVLLLIMFIRIYHYRQYLHPRFIICLYSLHLYLGLELILAIGALLARVILGLELEPQFDEPYLATSLQEFWGRRWNLVVTNILRPTVYEPVRSMSIPVLGRRWTPLAALVATFLVSAVMHEIIFFYLTRASPTWEVTWFFVLHGSCTAAEVVVKKVVAGRWRLHRVVSGALTVGFVVVTGEWLFFPQFLRYGLDRKAIEEYAILADFIKTGFQKIISLDRGPNQ